jgi:anti-anti-sigma regulatory factor
LSEEEEQKRQPAKDYAFERVRRVPPVQEGGGAQEFFPIMFSMISENRERIMVVGVLLAVLWSGVYLFSGRTRQKVVPRSEAGQESRRVSRVIGRVSSTSDEPPGVFMVTPQHQTLLVLGAASQLLHASPGQSFELEISTATIKPFGVTMVKMGRVIRELGKGQGQRWIRPGRESFMAEKFAITEKTERDVVIFLISGYFGEQGGQKLAARVDELLCSRREKLIIDLAECSVLASPGFGALLEIVDKVVEEFGGTVVFSGPSAVMLQVMNLTHIASLVRIEDTLDNARAWMETVGKTS